MTTRKFWPLDFDPEGEIYENVSWDLPGYKLAGTARAKAGRQSVTPLPKSRSRA